MSKGNEHAENFLLFLAVGGLVLAGALYGLFLFWPYFVFFVLPLVIGSLVIGVILKVSVEPSFEGSQVDYKNLAVTFPVLIVTIMVVFFAGSEHTVLVDKKGVRTGTYLEWPEFNKAFNEHRASVYGDSPFDALKARARVPVMYDRQDAGWISLWCLFLGGPLFFWFLSSKDRDRNEEIVLQKVNERTKATRERLAEKERDLSQIIATRTATLNNQISDLDQRFSAMTAENRILKAKVEFSPDIPRSPEAQKSNGVLDQDLF
jgi:hypothetical protein